jgi:hypothetical protein
VFNKANCSSNQKECPSSNLDTSLSSTLSIYADPSETNDSKLEDSHPMVSASLRLISLCASEAPSREIRKLFPECCFKEEVNEESKDFGRKFQTIQAVGLGIKLKELLGGSLA